MSIASEITRINNNIANAYDECETKGATMPQYENSANLATTIASIPSGGGADLSEYFKTQWDENVSSTTNFQYYGITKLPSIKFGEGVTSAEYFMYGTKFKNISFEKFDCTNITSLKDMFNNCAYTYSIDFSNVINTSSINNVQGLCNSCTNLETITNIFPLTNQCSLATSFMSCNNLKILDLSKWKLKPSNTTQTFNGSTKITILDISGLDFENYSGGGNMFSRCGINCLQSDGAYANGIPYVYVKDATAQNWVLTASNGHPDTWSTNNVVIKQTPSN